MSISTSWYADYANHEKEKWELRLSNAYEARDWDAVHALLLDMEKHKFSE